MSIKPLPPEAIETFSILLHPKRKYSARAREIIPNSSSSWSPKDASVPLLAWYRADTAHDAGLGQVDVWPDQSGVGDANRNQTRVADAAVTKNAADAAYGNKPTLTFSGGGHFNSAGSWSVAPFGAPLTIVIVGNIANACLSLTTLGSPEMLWSNGSNDFRFYNGAGNSPSGGGGPLASDPAVLMFEDDGTGSASAAKLFSDSLSVAIATATTAMRSDNYTLDLALGVAGVTDLLGKLAEVMVFAGILTPTDKANLKTYLNATRAYGISVT